MKWLKTFWFLLALAGVIGAAYLAPAWPARLGALAGWIRTACIVGIFLVSGLVLPTQVLRASMGHGRLHGFIQGFNLVLIPALFALLRPILLSWGMDPVLADGFVIMACVPTTVASSVAMTAMARGNEAGAICNSTLGNLLGVIVSPLLVYLLLSLRGSLDWVKVIRELTLLVVLPTGIGQLLRLPMKHWVTAQKKRLGSLSQCFLLVVVYFVFTATFSRELAVSGGALLVVVAIVLVAHLGLLALNWRLSAAAFLGFTRGDRIAALMCGTQKTVALGIPLVTVLYDHQPIVGLITVPLLCYHPLQLLIGTFIAIMLGRQHPPSGWRPVAPGQACDSGSAQYRRTREIEPLRCGVYSWSLVLWFRTAQASLPMRPFSGAPVLDGRERPPRGRDQAGDSARRRSPRP